jgi:hypothetical protein
LNKDESHRDQPVAVSLKAESRVTCRAAPRRFGALAAVLLGGVIGGSCVVPQQIDAYTAPPAATHAPVLIEVQTASPREAVKCIDQTNLSTTSFGVLVTDEDKTALTARWFLNYDFSIRSAYQVLFQDEPQDRNNVFLQLDPTVLGLQGRQPGIYALEVVVSDGFDPDLTTPPANRQILKGNNVASYKWVIDYRGSGSCPPL